MTEQNSPFSIGEPVDSIPPNLGRPSKFGALYQAAEAAEGRWIPATFPAIDKAAAFCTSVHHVQKRRFETRRSGCVVYVRVRPEAQA